MNLYSTNVLADMSQTALQIDAVSSSAILHMRSPENHHQVWVKGQARYMGRCRDWVVLLVSRRPLTLFCSSPLIRLKLFRGLIAQHGENEETIQANQEQVQGSPAASIAPGFSSTVASRHPGAHPCSHTVRVNRRSYDSARDPCYPTNIRRNAKGRTP